MMLSHEENGIHVLVKKLPFFDFKITTVYHLSMILAGFCRTIARERVS